MLCEGQLINQEQIHKWGGDLFLNAYIDDAIARIKLDKPHINISYDDSQPYDMGGDTIKSPLKISSKYSRGWSDIYFNITYIGTRWVLSHPNLVHTNETGPHRVFWVDLSNEYNKAPMKYKIRPVTQDFVDKCGGSYILDRFIGFALTKTDTYTRYNEDYVPDINDVRWSSWTGAAMNYDKDPDILVQVRVHGYQNIKGIITATEFELRTVKMGGAHWDKPQGFFDWDNIKSICCLNGYNA